MSQSQRQERFGQLTGALFLEPRQPQGQLSILLAAAVLFGGGGVAYGLANLVIQLLAIFLIAASPSAVGEFVRSGPRGLVILAIATCALPALQLVPLPPSVWMLLPGRELVVESFSLSGHERDWFPLSVGVGPTLVAFLSLIPPFAILALGWRIPKTEIARLHHLVVVLGLLCAGFGLACLALGNYTGLYPERPQVGVLFGTFANRNSTGVFLVCCLLLLIALPDQRRMARMELLLRIFAGAILTTAVVLTQSRSSMALLALPALLLATRLVAIWRAQRRTGYRPTPSGLIAAALLAAAAVGCVAAFLHSGRVEASFARFDEADGLRSAMWEDAYRSAERYWPAGAGMGSFDDVFQLDESLEHVTTRRAGRAHNDYLEIAVESGLAGIALAIGWVVWCVAATWRGVRRADWPAAGAAGVGAAIALQSVLDYPLRNQTMLCLAAFAILVLARAASSPERAA